MQFYEELEDVRRARESEERAWDSYDRARREGRAMIRDLMEALDERNERIERAIATLRGEGDARCRVAAALRVLERCERD